MGTRPFLKTRYRGILGREGEGDHWSGGEPLQQDAICPGCKIPLLLLWDINCRDRRFPRGKFGALNRLPLYFCWGCVSDLAFQLPMEGRIKPLHTLRRNGPSFQYEPYPTSFPRQPLSLVPGIPDDVRAALAAWDTEKNYSPKRLSKDQRAAALDEFFGRHVQTTL